MSWHLTVTNNYHGSIQIPNITVLAPNAPPYKVPNTLGHINIIVDGLGAINFTDIGDKDIGGYSKASLRRRRRNPTHDQLLGQAELTTNGSISQIKLPSFIYK